MLPRLLESDLSLADVCCRDFLWKGLRWTEMERLSKRREEERWRRDLERRCGVGGHTVG